MNETRILIRLLRIYIPRNGEFGLALSKLRNFGGEVLNPPQPPSVHHCYSGYWVFFLAVQRLGHCTDHQPLSSTEYVCGYNYTSTSRCAFKIHIRVTLAFNCTTSQMFVPFYQTTGHHMPANGYVHRRSSRNLKFHRRDICLCCFLLWIVLYLYVLISSEHFVLLHTCIFLIGKELEGSVLEVMWAKPIQKGVQRYMKRTSRCIGSEVQYMFPAATYQPQFMNVYGGRG
jgi:hypothetical protein